MELGRRQAAREGKWEVWAEKRPLSKPWAGPWGSWPVEETSAGWGMDGA